VSSSDILHPPPPPPPPPPPHTTPPPPPPPLSGVAANGDVCANCGKGKLPSYRGIDAGTSSVLGTHYPKDARALPRLEAEQKPSHCLLRIGVSLLVATAIDHHNDSEVSAAMYPLPYQCTRDPGLRNAAVGEAAQKLYYSSWAQGVEVVWTIATSGRVCKFKDADLIGIPLRSHRRQGLAGKYRADTAHRADPRSGSSCPSPTPRA